MEIIARDRFHIVENNHGNYYVAAETAPGEHHMTNRADALRFLRGVMGDDWHIRVYVGTIHYRNSEGYPSHARRYAAVRIPA